MSRNTIIPQLLRVLFLLHWSRASTTYTTSELRAALESDCLLNSLHAEYTRSHQHTRPPHEQTQRLQLFRQEIEGVLEERDNSAVTWEVDISFMADMTQTEQDLYRTGHNDTAVEEYTTLESGLQAKTYSAPDYYNGWRERALLRPITPQKKGSCWAHSAAIPLEAQLGAKNYKYVKLSAQELFDCGLPKGKHELGGTAVDAWNYVMKSNHLTTDKEVPEIGGADTQGHDCSWYKYKTNALEGATVTSINAVRKTHVEKVKYIISTISPVTVSAETVTSKLNRYKSGIFKPLKCGPDVDHAMVIVGYAADYWLVRNSWANFGENGYVRWTRSGKDCFEKQFLYPYLEVATPIQKRGEADKP